MTTYCHHDAGQCFAHAIFMGALSEQPSAPHYAGAYMYMHSDERHDHFKHCETRQYVKSPLLGAPFPLRVEAES